jgi:hypothetical protein
MVIKGELEEWRGQREEVIALLELKGDESLGLICSMQRPKRMRMGDNIWFQIFQKCYSIF